MDAVRMLVIVNRLTSPVTITLRLTFKISVTYYYRSKPRSELNTARGFAHLKSGVVMKQTYVIWNPAKLHQVGLSDDPKVGLEDLLVAEAVHGISVSTQVVATLEVVKDIIRVCAYETDMQLQYKTLPNKPYELWVFRTSEYADIDEAMKDGAAYDTGVKISAWYIMEEPSHASKLIKASVKAAMATAKCAGISDVSVVLVRRNH